MENNQYKVIIDLGQFFRVYIIFSKIYQIAFQFISNIHCIAYDSIYYIFKHIPILYNGYLWIYFIIMAYIVVDYLIYRFRKSKKDLELKKDLENKIKIILIEFETLKKEFNQMNKDIKDLKQTMKRTKGYVSNIYDKLLITEIIDY